MREYWMRIALGALAIFVVGMIGVSLVRHGMSGVREVAEGTGPISIPIMFVPFKLDGERLGTIRRVKVERSAPDQVKRVDITVRLADSVSPARLEGCILVAEGFEQFNSQTTIRCAAPADTAGHDLVNIGEIRLTPGNRSFSLLMPREAIRELTDSDSMFVGEDPPTASEEASLDSLATAAELKAESVIRAGRARQAVAESLARAARRMADSVRRR